jgi:hypothetical protein
MTLCHSCEFDLRDAPHSEAGNDSPPDTCEIEFQETLLATVRDGWIFIEGYGATYSHLYFKVLHQLMRIMATGRRAPALRVAAIERFGLSPFMLRFAGDDRDLERLDITARRGLLTVARHLLEGWPHTLVEFCKANRVWSSTLLRDLDDVPFWYWCVVNEHLYRTSYCPSDEEIDSAVRYIRKSGAPLNKKSLSRCLGVTAVHRKRKTWKPDWES